jgi:alpha-L-rhamnosidase
MSITLSNVSFEHHRDTLGIGESAPRISWKFSSTAKNCTQESYEIEVARERSSRLEQYMVKSSESVQVPWLTKPLESREWAKIRVRSFGSGYETPWSEA